MFVSFQAVSALVGAERPLIIVGKGAGYARAERECLEIVEQTQIPFLPTPMGKGVIPDDHPLSIAPARSLALKVLLFRCLRRTRGLV